MRNRQRWAGWAWLWWVGVVLILAAGLFLTGIIPWQAWLAQLDSTKTKHDFNEWAGVANVISGFTGVLGIILTVVSMRTGGYRPGPARRRHDRAAASDDLTERMLTFWSNEQYRLGLNDPDPIHLTWAWTDNTNITPRATTVLTHEAAQRCRTVSPDGSLTHAPKGSLAAAATFFTHDLTAHQLVVLGEPGAGKTTLTLQVCVALLNTAAHDQTALIPVLINATTWDPDNQTLNDLLRAALATSWGQEPPAGPLDPRLFVILDGFDEIPESAQPQAMRHLIQASATGRPFLITSRTRPYLDAVAATGGDIPARAGVITLQPATTTDITNYLAPPAKPHLAKHWEPVTTALRTNPDGPLAKTLSTPLMAWLARTTITPPRINTTRRNRPATTREWLSHQLRSHRWETAEKMVTPADLAAAPTPANARELLLGNYLKVIYQTHTPTRDTPADRRARPYPPTAATRWLTVLTANDLNWRQAVPAGRLIQAAVVLLAFAVAMTPLTAALALLNPEQPLIGHIFAAWLAVRAALLVHSTETENDSSDSTRNGVVKLGMLALGIAMTTRLLDLMGFTLLLSVGLWVLIPQRTSTEARLSLLLKRPRNIAGVIVAAGSVIFTTLLILTGPSDANSIRSLGAVALVYGTAAAMQTRIWPPIAMASSRTILTLHGDLPVRIQAFLRDAHTRGLLRATPTGYQIRHLLIANHLTMGYAPDRTAREAVASLAVQGRFDELRDLADRGDPDAQERLAVILRIRGDIDELRRRADDGDPFGQRELADALTARGNLDELRHRANTGDPAAGARFAGFTHARNSDELRTLADNDDQYAQMELAFVLTMQGDIDELRHRANKGDQPALAWLGAVLVARGDLSELRDFADRGEGIAQEQVADALTARGDLEELRDLADHGDKYASYAYIGALRSLGATDELRTRANDGDKDAKNALADLSSGGNFHGPTTQTEFLLISLPRVARLRRSPSADTTRDQIVLRIALMDARRHREAQRITLA